MALTSVSIASTEDRKPATYTGPWTWAGPSLLARSPTPTEGKRLAEDANSPTGRSNAAAIQARAPFVDLVRDRRSDGLAEV
jgi:hypothetical protein